mgnify:CR=1 FL=1
MVLIYLIPKNIKTKREIFKGFGILEILAMGIACGFGFLLQSLVSGYKLKIFLFFIFPILCFLLLIPLPNGSTVLVIFKKFIIYKKHQEKYRYK